MPARGQWRALPFAMPSSLNKWAILNLENRRIREDNLRSLERDIITNGSKVGMKISPAFLIETFTTRYECFLVYLILNFFYLRPGPSYDKDLIGFFNGMKNQGVQMVFVVVPDRGDFYARVKTTAEIHVGMLTQCVKSNTVSRMKPATVSNILLKVFTYYPEEIGDSSCLT